MITTGLEDDDADDEDDDDDDDDDGDDNDDDGDDNGSAINRDQHSELVLIENGD